MAPLGLRPLLATFLCVNFLLVVKANVPSADVSCTFQRCSLSSPCSQGTCNNGYCCEATSDFNRRKGRFSKLNSTGYPFKADDWPGPLSNNFGYNNGMLSLDGIKFIDPQLCAGGFSSTIKCAMYSSCPPGLICDYKSGLCCPHLLPLNENKHLARRNFHHYQPNRYNQFQNNYANYLPNNNYGNGYFPRMSFMHRYPNYMNVDRNDMSSISQQMRQRGPMNQYPCDNCDNTQPNYYAANNQLGSLNSVDACSDGVNENGNCGVGGQCNNGYACNRNNMCCQRVERVIPATVSTNRIVLCPDGTQAAGGCVNGQCGFGFLCNQGLCCSNSSQTPRCLDGSQAIGACMQGKCGENYLCTTGNICCPASLSMCPAGTSAIGPCVNGVCPTGYACINNQCCGPPSAANSNLLTTCPEIDSNGPCQSDNTCPEPGFSCDMNNNWCCPNISGDPVGPCIRGEGNARLCPDGYTCVGPDSGQCYKLETGTCAPEDQFGPCNPTNPQCPPGYTCIGGFCCANERTAGASYQRRKRSILAWNI